MPKVIDLFKFSIFCTLLGRGDSPINNTQQTNIMDDYKDPKDTFILFSDDLCPTNATHLNNPYKFNASAPRFSNAELYKNEVRVARRIAIKKTEELHDQLNGIFTRNDAWLSNISSEYLQELKDYCFKLTEIIPRSELVESGLGYCNESSAKAIRNAIRHQLKTGKRSYLQRIVLFYNFYEGFRLIEDAQSFLIQSEKPLSVNFPTYSSFWNYFGYNYYKDIVGADSEVFTLSGSLKDSWRDFIDSNGKIHVCDGWLGYTGDPYAYIEKFLANPALEGTYHTMAVRDFSIPSFRKDKGGIRPEQRKFFIELISSLVETGTLPIEMGNTKTVKP